MEVRKTAIVELIKQDDAQFQIPLYQRPYTWGVGECGVLWADILDQIDEHAQSDAPHFLGAVVLAPAHGHTASAARYLVVDGQQRLTAISLAIAALRDSWPEEANRIGNQYLINQYNAKGDNRFRLLPTQKDRETYRKVLLGATDANSINDAIANGYRFFCEQIKIAVSDGISPKEIEEAMTGRLEIIDVTTEANQNPHRIFESLNNTGRSLSQADLIRNMVFQLLGGAQGDEVYERDWRYLEGIDSDGSFEALMWLKLVLDCDRSTRKKNLYADQQRWFDRMGRTAEAAERYVCDLAELAPLHQLILNPAYETNPEVRAALERLQRWRAGATHPVVMLLLRDRAHGNLGDPDVLKGLNLIESFLVRRTFISRTTSGLAKIFQAIPAQLSDQMLPPVEGLHALLSVQHRNWPTDTQLREAMLSQPFYETSSKALLQRRYILERLEAAHGSTEYLDFEASKYQIEHIMPQKPTKDWLESLQTADSDEMSQDIHRKLLHTIGNLTLTVENSRLSNRMFNRKQKIYETSRLEMNREIAETAQWTGREIIDRGNRLADLAMKIWPGPLQQ